MRLLRTALSVLVVLAVFTPGVVQAQTTPAARPPEAESRGGFTFGLKGGLNVASLLNEEGDTGARMAPAGGAFGAWQSGGNLGVQVEALYSPKGLSIGSQTYQIDYLEFPVLATIGPRPKRALRPFFTTGLAPAIKVKTHYPFDSDAAQETFDEFVRTWDVGWVIGGGVDLPLGAGGLVIEGRYTLGLLRLFNAEPSDTDVDDKNQAIAVLVGYRF